MVSLPAVPGLAKGCLERRKRLVCPPRLADGLVSVALFLRTGDLIIIWSSGGAVAQDAPRREVGWGRLLDRPTPEAILISYAATTEADTDGEERRFQRATETEERTACVQHQGPFAVCRVPENGPCPVPIKSHRNNPCWI